MWRRNDRLPLRGLTITLVLVIGLAGCDGVSSFERTNSRDPKSDAYVPRPPDSLSVHLIAPDVTQLTWQNKSRGEDEFVLKRSRNGAPFVDVARLPANDTTAQDTLTQRGVYRYSVAAVANSDFRDTIQSASIPVTGWMDGPSLTESHENTHAARTTVLSDHSILLISPSSSEVYDPDQNTWQSIPHPIRGEDNIWFGDSVSLVALTDGNALYTYRKKRNRLVHRFYDSETNSWRSIQALSLRADYYERAYTTVLSDGRVLVVGRKGVQHEYGDGYDYTGFAGVWNPSADSFRSTASPPGRLDYRAVASLPNNRALLTAVDSGGRWKRHCAVFDGHTETWTRLNGCAPLGRSDLSRTRLSDGRIVVFKSVANSAHVFNPDTQTWRSTPFPDNIVTTTALTTRSGTAVAILRHRLDFTHYRARFNRSTNQWRLGPPFPEKAYHIPDHLAPLKESPYALLGISPGWGTSVLFEPVFSPSP